METKLTKFKSIIVALIMVFGLALTVQSAPAANAGAPSGQITRAYYPSNPGYGPNVMYMRCVKNNGVAAQIGLTIGQSSKYNHDCRYVYDVYVPTGGWTITCDAGNQVYSVKWAGEGWKSWPGTNWITCYWT